VPDRSGPAVRPDRAARPPGAPILEVSGLSVDYATDRGSVRAVDDVSFELAEGEFLGIVGESGCGKSTLLFAIAQLLAAPAGITAGSVAFQGTSLVGLTDRELAAVRWRDLSVVMQSAMNALNPVKSIGAQFKDALRAHDVRSANDIAALSADVLGMVGIDKQHLRSYPHQLSGGMRQRAMIAMAMLFTPDLVIMDEPTSALDVVAQRSLMVQIKELQRRFGFAIIFVTHDMSLVSHFSDRLMVMYAGQVAEFGATRQVFDAPMHPYSTGLLEAFPSIRGPRVPLTGIPGSPPDLARPPAGCRFAPRCPKVMERCGTDRPGLYDVGGVQVRCFVHGGGYGGDPAGDYGGHMSDTA
jgi:peptide/nickel transport system ATP-binding protein